MNKKKSSAVVLGLGGANALGVVRSLGYEGIPSMGFHMGSRKSDAHLSKYMRDACFVSDEKGLVRSLVDYGKSQDERGVVFATGDDYISFCSRNETALESYFYLPHSSTGDLAKLIEKEENSKIGERAGFKVPRSVLLSNYESPAGGPVIVKPLSSIVGGKGDMRMYDSDRAMLRDKDKLLKAYGDMLVQDFVSGDNRNLVEVHAYKSSGGVVLAGMQRNELAIQASPSIYMGVVFRSIWDESLVEPSIKLANELDFNGALDINLKKSDHDGQFYFMEVNLRTSANLSLDTAEGINLPAIIYRDLRAEDFSGLLPDGDRNVGGAWVHESRISRFFNQGGSRRNLLESLKDVRANVFYDPSDMGPLEGEEAISEMDSDILKRSRFE